MKKLHEFIAGTGTAFLVGNPAASAINAPQGKKYDAFKDAYGNVLVDREIGGTAGALAGAGMGYGAGALLAKSKKGQKAAAKLVGSGPLASRLENYKLIKAGAKPVGALAGALGGLVVGSTAGIFHGHFGKRAQEIRNRDLSANLKPALRELAARSEAIVEFAMVRDASGRYVEVEDEDGGMGLGGAIKTGAGAAALGGAGYGAYRGHKAVMGRFGTVSGMTQADRVGGLGAAPISERLANLKAAKTAVASGGMAQAKGAYSAAGKYGMNAAKQTGRGLLSKVAGLAKFLR